MNFEDFVTTLEKPVKNAVLVLVKNGEPTASSGFYRFLNQKWGIVLNGYPSELVLEAARLSGLQVSSRCHVRWRYEVGTDVWLDDCLESEPEKASIVFDLFGRIYEQLASVVERNHRDRFEMKRRAFEKISRCTLVSGYDVRF